MKKTIYTLLAAAVLAVIPAYAQEKAETDSIAEFLNAPARIHSHNDYFRTMPFYEAYSQKAESIECDMFLVDGVFLVGHDRKNLSPERTFEELYLDQIVRTFRLNGGVAWKDEPERPIQLMIDLKSSDKKAFMKALVERLDKHRDIFDPSVNPHACKVVITGYFPHEEGCASYPDYIFYDYGNTEDELTEEELSHVIMFSPYLGDFSKWDGKSRMSEEDEAAVRAQVEKAHAKGKPIRFWGGPDNFMAWLTLRFFGVDFLNTDRVAESKVLTNTLANGPKI